MDNALETKYAFVKQEVVRYDTKNPIELAADIMKKNLIGIHGPEHHFLDGAAFLAAYKNEGGEIDLEDCLEELARRAIRMPGAMCGHWGICGSVASIGAAFSIIHGTSPLSTDEHYKNNMEYTSSVLSDMSKIGGARCCKRNAFLALSKAVEFANEKYGVKMENGNVRCEFSSFNRQCLGSACPFHG